VTLNEPVVVHYKVLQHQVLSGLDFEPAYKTGVLTIIIDVHYKFDFYNRNVSTWIVNNFNC
jgi:hypothetical protein